MEPLPSAQRRRRMGSKYPRSLRICLPPWALLLEAALLLFLFFTSYDIPLTDQKTFMGAYQGERTHLPHGEAVTEVDRAQGHGRWLSKGRGGFLFSRGVHQFEQPGHHLLQEAPLGLSAQSLRPPFGCSLNPLGQGVFAILCCFASLAARNFAWLLIWGVCFLLGVPLVLFCTLLATLPWLLLPWWMESLRSACKTRARRQA